MAKRIIHDGPTSGGPGGPGPGPGGAGPIILNSNLPAGGGAWGGDGNNQKKGGTSVAQQIPTNPLAEGNKAPLSETHKMQFKKELVIKYNFEVDVVSKMSDEQIRENIRSHRKAAEEASLQQNKSL